jgi:hypothetical protein
VSYHLDAVEQDMRMILRLRRERRMLVKRLEGGDGPLSALEEARVHAEMRMIDERVGRHKYRVMHALEKDANSFTRRFAEGLTILSEPKCPILLRRLRYMFRYGVAAEGCRCEECYEWRVRFQRHGSKMPVRKRGNMLVPA